MALQPYPASLTSSKEIVDIALDSFCLDLLAQPFELPKFTPKFENIAAFVNLDSKVQIELLREELHNKVCRVPKLPKEEDENLPAEKHCHFQLPHGHTANELSIPSSQQVQKVPPRSQWANYFVVLQQQLNSHEMKNVALAYCTQFRRQGVVFRICRGDEVRVAQVAPGTEIYCRPLASCSFRKTHFEAIKYLGESATHLEGSSVTTQILKGKLDEDVRTVQELDQWIEWNLSNNNLGRFNKQQQRALALDELTEEGIVLIHGPPGTGKSHVLCHGLIPQASLKRGVKMLVLCNSNVAVDALMAKCMDIESLKGRMVRCGYKANVSDDIVNKGFYAEGDTATSMDRFGNQSGSNSNTNDEVVQYQIRSKSVVFTTVHFASKEKGTSDSSYWNFDTLVLDEAAQIEDSKLFILLARCPTLKKIILVGDPRQLQPYVSDSLRKQGHGKSTMERLMESSATDSSCNLAPFVMLERQFRMAPLLRGLVSELFYNNRLEDAECVRSRGPIETISLKPLLVIDLTGTKMQLSKLHQSYENLMEAAVCKELYNFLFSTDFEGVLNIEESLMRKDVCVLSPFNRQKDRLRMEICNASEADVDAHMGLTYNRSSSSPVKKSQSLLGKTADESVDSDLEVQLASIETVDKMQGSERKVVIVSTCVDTHPLRAADPCFINVACSRAQHLLVIVGNFKEALNQDPNWSKVRLTAVKDGTYLEHEVAHDDNGVLNTAELLSQVGKMIEGKERKQKRGLDLEA